MKDRLEFDSIEIAFGGRNTLNIEKMKAIIMLAKTKKGIIITDHLHRHVMEMSDRLYVLANGQTYLIRDHAQLISLGYVNSL
ncbi:MAG TPA: hypothetical protein VIQ51_17095 [Chryseosolibacter sp.]|jgi:ABC-type (unclassified) transport system, ATPase component